MTRTERETRPDDRGPESDPHDMRERTDLEVPFAQKDEAKSLGARWDPKRRTWYAPPGLDRRLFQRWLPTRLEEGGTRLVPPIYSVESETACWRCGTSQRVVTVAAEHFFDRGEDEQPLEHDLYLFSGIQYLPRQLLEAMRTVNPGYRLRASKTAGTSYYMNHCRCGAQLGDFYMHSEPGGAFCPTTPAAAAAIRLRRVESEATFWISGQASMSYPNLIRDHATRIPS